MRNQFMKVAVLACLAIIPTMSYGQEPPAGSGTTTARGTLAFKRAELNPSDCRAGSSPTLTWQFNEAYKLDPAMPIGVSLIMGDNTSSVGSSIVGTANADGSRSFVIVGIGERLAERVTGRTPAKLRLAVTIIVDGESFSQTKDLDFTLLPANRQPLLVGKLTAPLEGDGDSSILVGTDGNITDPDGDRLSFKIEKFVSTTNVWRQVASGDTLPLSLRLDPSGPAPYAIKYRICAEEVATSNLLFMEPVEFSVTIKATGAPPAPSPDPTPPAPKPADPAPVASTATAAVSTSTAPPHNVRIRVLPDNHVVGGNSVGLKWSAEDVNKDALFLVVKYRNPSNGVAVVMSSTTNPFELKTSYVPSERRLQLDVSVSNGHAESDPQLIELVLAPVERTIIDERQFKDDVKVDQHSMGRRMADAKMFSPGAVDYEFYTDDNGNMQVRERQPEPPSSAPATGEKKSSAPPKKK